MAPKSRKAKYILSPQPLGKGGQAEVFEARHRETNQVVALKQVLSRDTETIARMRREISVQSYVQHPNIVPVLDQSASHVWYTMPLAKQVLGKTAVPLNDLAIANIIRDCANGLAAAHNQGFVHRDITPNNILLLEDDKGTRWAVSDWGLVRQHGQTTVARTLPGHPFGTLGFAAPELWEDAHSADARADVYSLGQVIGWCLTGKWPAPNTPLIPAGRWEYLVKYMTILDKNARLPDMEAVINLVDFTISSFEQQREEASTPHQVMIPVSSEYHPESTSLVESTSIQDATTQDLDQTSQATLLPPLEAKSIIAKRAREAVRAIKQKNMELIAQLAHPEKGVRFSPSAYVSLEDQVFTSSELRNLVDDTTLYRWGYTDGLGEPIDLAFNDYYLHYIYSQDFAEPERISYNESAVSSNTANNVPQFYHNCIYVEYYFIGFDPQFSGMDWEALRIVFQELRGEWYIVGIVHERWTI